MSYDPNNPLPQDIPNDSQSVFMDNFETLNNFFGVNHIPFGNSIFSATSANPCVIVSENHRLANGENISIFALTGLNDAGVVTDWSINGNSYNITLIDDDTFSIPVDTTSEPAYISNSGNFLSNNAGYGYGYHKLINFSKLYPNPASVFAPKSSIFTKNIEYKWPGTLEPITELVSFFKNNANSEVQLTGFLLQGDTFETLGFNLPWNLKVNLGSSEFDDLPAQTFKDITYKIPYTLYNFGTIITLQRTQSLSSSADLRVSTSNLTSFRTTRQSTNNNTGRVFYYISMGI